MHHLLVRQFAAGLTVLFIAAIAIFVLLVT